MFFISGAQNLNAPCDSFRATGPWFTQNYGRCDSISAPGFAEQTLPERILAVPLPKLRESVLETCRGGAEGESAEGREKPPWGVPLPRAGLGPAPTKRKDSYQPLGGRCRANARRMRGQVATHFVGADPCGRPWRSPHPVGRGLLDAPRTSAGRSRTGPYVKNRRFLDTP